LLLPPLPTLDDGGSGNNEDEHNTKSTKRSFDQFNDDKIQRDQNLILIGGNNENVDFGAESFTLSGTTVLM